MMICLLSGLFSIYWPITGNSDLDLYNHEDMRMFMLAVEIDDIRMVRHLIKFSLFAQTKKIGSRRAYK